MFKREKKKKIIKKKIVTSFLDGNGKAKGLLKSSNC